MLRLVTIVVLEVRANQTKTSTPYFARSMTQSQTLDGWCGAARSCSRT
jgi:hypothetical protein